MPVLIDVCRPSRVAGFRGLLARAALLLAGALAGPVAAQAATLVAEFEGLSVTAQRLVAQGGVAVVQADPDVPADSRVSGRFALNAAGVDLNPDPDAGLFTVDAQVDLQVGGRSQSLQQLMHLSLSSTLAGDLLTLSSQPLPGVIDAITLKLALEPGGLDLNAVPTTLLGLNLLDTFTQALLGADSTAFEGSSLATGRADGTVLGHAVSFRLTGLTGFAAASPVPEPSAAACLALGLAATAGRRIRRGRRSNT